ncbi:hydroxylamine reductase [Raphidocelis subcapitata]|uniref:Hydroxylamine reductase n=1 Tax=Raphidocelis subcapitata TaxID=307507 RepID=A0A2V0PQ31_9CHLO|nr:hydroxylamine reductase [Raphidocelis subcapitata]|eukprot:GBF99305.1 hydroxylamine reductase [Raphidocelis subcapitata]
MRALNSPAAGRTARVHRYGSTSIAAVPPRPLRQPRGAAAPRPQPLRFTRAPDHAPSDSEAANDMFCFQCEQTLHGTGCTSVPAGVCGKTVDVANLQDLLTFQLKGLCSWAHFAHGKGLATPDADSFVKAAIFSTLTNVNFDPERFRDYCTRADELARGLKAQLRAAGVEGGPAAEPLPWFDEHHPVDFSLRAALGTDAPTLEALEAFAPKVSLLARRGLMGADAATLLGLHELVAYGLRGVAAYAHHAEMLGQVDPSLDDVFEETMAFLASPASQDPGAVLGVAMRLGEANFRTMALLDRGHTTRFGHPEPSPVRLTPVVGKAILVSGHDMQDLHDLLVQTEGTGLNVYTHGEMLPAHGYPGLKKFKHLVGNYGGAWYKQKEFGEFPGAILMTTNCIMPPAAQYADRIFTTGEVGVQGSPHIHTKDYGPLIERAKQLPGFTYEPPEPKFVTTGFGHEATLGAASLVLDAIKAGELSHIFLVGGCDAPEPSRKYYTEVVKGLPRDTIVLTLGCGKYRFYDQDLGTLPNGLPRLLDMGQCNDAYSALVVATELAKALGTDVNALPLSLDISWFEQKAVAVLLTLLHLGVKNIRLGPNLPAFLTPEATALLVEAFNIMPADTKSPAAEVERMMAGIGEVGRGR